MDYIYLGLSLFSFMLVWHTFASKTELKTSEKLAFWIGFVTFIFCANQYIHSLIK